MIIIKTFLGELPRWKRMTRWGVPFSDGCALVHGIAKFTQKHPPWRRVCSRHLRCAAQSQESFPCTALSIIAQTTRENMKPMTPFHHKVDFGSTNTRIIQSVNVAPLGTAREHFSLCGLCLRNQRSSPHEFLARATWVAAVFFVHCFQTITQATQIHFFSACLILHEKSRCGIPFWPTCGEATSLVPCCTTATTAALELNKVESQMCEWSTTAGVLHNGSEQW